MNKGRMYSFLHLADGDTEAQGSDMTWPKIFNGPMAKLGTENRFPRSLSTILLLSETASLYKEACYGEGSASIP